MFCQDSSRLFGKEIVMRLTWTTLLRTTAVAAASSGLLNLVFFAVHPSGGEPPSASAVGSWYAPLHALDILSLLLALVALTGLYLVQAGRVGWLGLAGYLLAFVGSVLLIGLLWGAGFFTRLLARRAPGLVVR